MGQTPVNLIPEASKMKDNRKTHRANILDEFIIINQTTGAQVGSLRNISAGGMQVLGPASFEPDNLYQLSLHLPKPIQGRSSIELVATCQWHSYDPKRRLHRAGFQFTDVSSEDQELILMLQTEYEFEASVTAAHL